MTYFLYEIESILLQVNNSALAQLLYITSDLKAFYALVPFSGDSIRSKF